MLYIFEPLILDSVNVRRIDKERNVEIEEVRDDEVKKAFLYSLRNNYTHKGLNTGSPGGGVFKGFGERTFVHGRFQAGYVPIHYDHANKEKIEYSVRLWPEVLKDTVLHVVEPTHE